MSTFKLACNNIRRNLSRFAMYYFSLMFCIFSTYTFLSLINNDTVFYAYSHDLRYKTMLVSFFIIILVCIIAFLLTSNSRFIRARKKEISTFMLFGMSNGKICTMLIYEVFIVGFVALVSSIFLGVLFSKFIALILINITLVEQLNGNLSFFVGLKPIIYTVLIYIAVFFTMGITSWLVITRFQLVDLFKASKVSEKRSKGSVILLLISLVMIGYGYYLASGKDGFMVMKSTFMILALVILGTYLFFYSGVPKILNILRKKKQNSYNGVKLITMSTLSHRMRTISLTMASIAVLSAVATTAVASTFTLYYNVARSSYSIKGQDLYYISDEALEKKVNAAIIGNGSEIEAVTKIQTYFTHGDITNIRDINSNNDKFKVYSEAMYNDLLKVSRYTKDKSVKIKNGESILLIRSNMFNGTRTNLLNKSVKLGEKEFVIIDPQYARNLTFGYSQVLVVSNEDFDSLMSKEVLKTEGEDGVRFRNITAVKFKGALNNVALNKKLASILEEGDGFSLVYDDYRDSLIVFGLICFIGIFMGILFILMTASQLYFEQIMLAEEEKHYYTMLRKIGIDESDERKMITNRLMPVFFIPLLIGICHSVFALKSADTVIFNQIVLAENTYLSVLKTSGLMYLAYIVVYTIFYIITKQQYKRLIK